MKKITKKAHIVAGKKPNGKSQFNWQRVSVWG